MCTILLIDDDRSFTGHIEAYVAERYPRIKLISCNNPLEALRMIAVEQYDLILIDLEMPALDGRKLMNFALQAGIKPANIVLLSGHDADYLHTICPSGSCLAVLNKFETRQREVLDMIFSSLSAKVGRGDVCAS